MKKVFLILLIILIGFSSVACINYTTTVEETTIEKKIGLLETNILLPINGELLIEYEKNFDLFESETIAFTSSNNAIATVNDLGKVIGVSFGECNITLSYNNIVYATLNVSVSNKVEISLPNKIIYSLGDNLNLNGASISLLDDQGEVLITENITIDMITEFDANKSGPQIVKFKYNNIEYGFEIYFLTKKQTLSTFNDCIVLNESIIPGEKLDLALTKSNNSEFLEAVNVYDYEEISIYAQFTSPSGEVKKTFGFWYQDYLEKLTETTILSTLNTEGRVYNHDRDYDYLVYLKEEGIPHYRFRFTPEESGEYHTTIVVTVDDYVIQTIEKTFTVENIKNEDFKGYIRVNETNNQHFIFEDGDTYIPVGQNVGWYTSTQRKHYDFKSWFEQMGSTNMNYARVWMAPWGYSVFWDDLYNYDSRQNRMYSLDKTLEYADEENIYIQLCLLNHGMFSAEVNPMWPNDTNNWYISRYGANPYSEIINSSGLFFSKQDVKELFKNQVKYIIARYGYSDTIMSFELFNEVDWIETYSALYGNLWHTEMAEFIKTIDPNQHLITTSQITESFYSSNYQVFKDDFIDYISIHRYGIYNHTTYLPEKQILCFQEFNKPVLYDEVGYQGWGGDQQIEADPLNISLHQELWAGALGGGAGTGMNWWWDSWIDQYDYYDQYLGIALFTKNMKLSGENYQFVTSEIDEFDKLTVNSSNIGYMGYLVDNRVYLYIYDTNYAINYTNLSEKINIQITIPGLTLGNYTYQVYDTFTGDILVEETILITNPNNFNVTLPAFDEDVAMKLLYNN